MRKSGETCGARWRGPDGTLESKPGFQTRRAAENYARDQEAAIRANTYVDPRAGRITLTEWVNQWYPALDLEPTTLSNYRYQIEVHILPTFGNRALASITAEEVSTWERQIAAGGYSKRTARDARSTLATVLGDAVPRYIQANPAQRRRGKGRKGQRRIQRIEQAGKAWPTPLEALLVAERCAALSGHDTDFVMHITVAYTGMRWSEVIGLIPGCVNEDRIDISWKLYELNGRFCRGRPKDGSIRPADLPPFLAQMLVRHLSTRAVRKCTCQNTETPWCPGDRYVFLGPGQGPLPPVQFQPPVGRGVTRLVSDAATGRCSVCGRAWPRRLDGSLIAHRADAGRCEGSGHPPAGDLSLASWLPVLTDLTPHGLRHGHQTWMDEDRIADVLKSERMGHEVPGMRGVYSHVSDAMRSELKAALHERWETSLRERAQLAPRSIVRVLHALLTQQRPPSAKIGSQMAPKIGHASGVGAVQPGRVGVAVASGALAAGGALGERAGQDQADLAEFGLDLLVPAGRVGHGSSIAHRGGWPGRSLDTGGYQRLSCPALGTHPGLMCPLRETSLSPRYGRPKVLQPPHEPPRICRQTAITIPPDTGARYRQDLPYGSPAWHARYATLRNTTEGLNGYAKDPAHQALAQPGRRRVRGLAAQSLFTALLLIAANIGKIRAWRAMSADDKATPTRRARRRRTSLRDYHPDG